MAQQKSVIKIQGSFDDMTFYQMNGKNFVKKKSPGVSKEMLKSDPRFKRTKENNQEFAGATAAATGLRTGFTAVSALLDNSFHRRAQSICRDVISKDTGIRGQRPFLPVAHKEGFTDLVLQKSISLDSVFKPSYSTSVSVGRYSATLSVDDFSPANMIDAPSGATHFKLLFQISALSSYEYNPVSKKYNAAFPEHNASAYYSLSSSNITVPVTTATLFDVDELPETMILLVCVGIQFYQAIGTNYYLLASGDAMKIVQVV